MTKVFKDLGKDTKDILTLDFLSGNGFSVIAQTKTPNGVTIKISLKRQFKKDEKTKITKESVEGIIEPKYEWQSAKIEFNGKLSTARDFTAAILVKDSFINGSKIEFSGAQNDKDGLSIKMVPSFKNDNFSGQASIAYPIPMGKKTITPPTKLVGELVLHYPHELFWGVNVLVDLEPQIKTKVEAALLVNASSNSQVSGRAAYVVKDESLVWGLSFFHKLSDVAKWALDYEVDIAKGPTVQVGGEYKVNHTSTLKGRAIVKVAGSTPDYRLALSAKQTVSKYFTATLGADLNVRQFLGESVGDAHSLGLQFKLSE